MTSPAPMGHNEAPDHAKLVTDRLTDEYGEIEKSVVAALDAARALPATCDSEEHQSEFAAVIKRLRDLNSRIEALRVAEKEPFLRGGNAVDSFFGRMASRLFRQKKTDKAGAADVLQARVDDYVQRKIAEERRKREEEERKAREAQRLAQAEAERLEREAAEAAAKAERARKAENEAKNKAVSEAAAAEAKRLRDEEELARQKAQEASAAATAKSADLVRTQTESGHMVTAKQVPFVEIVDEMELDPKILWAFVKSDAKLDALKAWAKTTQYKKPMAGAIIEMRDKAVIR